MRALLLLLALLAATAHAARLKDLGAFQGLRANQLTGYGVVVGLAGTGDDGLEFATQGVRGVAQRFGITLPPGVNPAVKNAAAVLLTAELPPFARPGQAIDVTVSSISNAVSLRGGALLMAPLKGADGQVYAIAQGNLTITVSESRQVSQPQPFSRGRTVTVPRSRVGVEEDGKKLAVVKDGVSLQQLVDGLNALGIGPRDMIAILQAVKAAGAIQADIEVM